MIAEWGGVKYARLPGRGWKALEELSPVEAMLLLDEIERLVTWLYADAALVRELAQRKLAEE